MGHLIFLSRGRNKGVIASNLENGIELRIGQRSRYQKLSVITYSSITLVVSITYKIDGERSQVFPEFLK